MGEDQEGRRGTKADVDCEVGAFSPPRGPAAQTSGITFVPLQRECVDVVVSKTRGREFARLLQAIVADEAFRCEYDRIVIGDTSQLGSIVYEC